MSDTNAIFGSLADNDDVQRNPLGMIYVEPPDYIEQSAPVDNAVNRGAREWIYVQIASGTTLVVGQGVARGLGALGYTACVVAPVDCPRHRVVGFAQGSIGAAGAARFAWLLRKGVGTAIADDGGVTVDQVIRIGNTTAGRVDSSAGGNQSDIGLCLGTALVSVAFTARFDCRG